MSIFQYTIILQPEEEGGYSVFVPALPGCFSQGESREEALANIQDALQLYLEDKKPEEYPPDINTTQFLEALRIVA